MSPSIVIAWCGLPAPRSSTSRHAATRAAAGVSTARASATSPSMASVVNGAAYSFNVAVTLLGVPGRRPPRRSPGFDPRFPFCVICYFLLLQQTRRVLLVPLSLKVSPCWAKTAQSAPTPANTRASEGQREDRASGVFWKIRDTRVPRLKILRPGRAIRVRSSAPAPFRISHLRRTFGIRFTLPFCATVPETVPLVIASASLATPLVRSAPSTML